LNISYSPQAAGDLDTIHAFISEHSAPKADEYVVRILQAIRMLESFPLIGGPDASTQHVSSFCPECLILRSTASSRQLILRF
jgi:plasmid stabilization system protein ParE